MELIGRYKVIEELARKPWGRVVRAQLNDGNRGDFAIKLENRSTLEDLSRSLSGRGMSGRAVVREPLLPVVERPTARAFFERSQLQKQAALKGQRWAAVHDLGTHEEAVYYVTDFYPHSAHFFVNLNTKLPTRTLNKLLSEIVAGLLELQNACGRTHGNLKLANVLLDGTGRRDRLRVKLTDPAASSTKLPTAADDVYAVGEILHQLLTHRSYRGNWPVQETEEWSRLGRGAASWLKLCNDLLTPDVESRLDLDQVRRRLGQLNRSEQAPRKLAVTGAAVLLAVVGAGVTAHSMEASADRKIHAARHDWLNSLLENPQRLSAYQDVLKNPVVIDSELESLRACFAQPKAGFPSFVAIQSKRHAALLISEIQGRVSQVYETSAATLRATTAGYEKLGWPQPAAQSKTLIDRPQPAMTEILPEIDQLGDWNHFLAENPGPRENWAVFQQKLSDITKRPDPDLVHFAAALRTTAGQSVEIHDRIWSDRIAEDTQLAEDVYTQGCELKIWPEGFDRERLIREEAQIAMSSPQRKDVREWVRVAHHYAYTTKKAIHVSKIDDLKRELSAIELEKAKDPKWFKDPADLPRYAQQARTLSERIQKLDDARFVEKDFEAGGEFADQCTQIANQIPLLRQFKRPAPDISVQLARLEGTIHLSSPSVLAYWKKHLTALGPVENISPGDREMVMTNAQSVADALKRLDKSLPLENKYALTGVWLTAATAERENRIELLLRQVGNTGTMLNDSTLQNETNYFGDWCGQVKKLSTQFPLGSGILDLTGAVVLQTAWSNKSDKGFWVDHVLEPHSPLHPILKDDLSRLAMVNHIAASSDSHWLADLAVNPKENEETVLAAWDRLNQIASEATLPTTPADVQVLAAVITNVRQRLQSPRFTSEQRAPRVGGLTKVAFQKWVGIANNASTPETLLKAWEMRSAFGIESTAALTPASRFNLSLARVRAIGAATPAADAVGDLRKSADEVGPAEAYAVQSLRAALDGPQMPWAQIRPIILASPYLWPADAARRQADFSRVAVGNARQLWDEGEPSNALRSIAPIQDPAARLLEKEIQDSMQNAAANQQQGMTSWKSGNYPQALDLFMRAARGGNAEAMLNLGGMYQGGQGARADQTVAQTWFLRSAKLGNLKAMLQVAALYDTQPNGRGEAVRWYTKAVEGGSITAAAKLADIDVRNGATREATARIALAERLESAGRVADPDLTTVMTDLARLYENSSNAPLAKEWYGRAAARKGEIAMQWVKRHQNSNSSSGIRIDDKVQ